MRPIPPTLAAHLAEPVTTIATCWRLQRRDGVLIALTTHDSDIEIDGIVYRAEGGLTATAMRESADLAVDNMEVEGMLSSRGLPEADLVEGRFDGARVDVFLVNWMVPQEGTLLLKRGTLGRVTRESGRFRAEFRGLSHAFAQPLTQVYSPACRAELGDRHCKRSLNAFEREVEVAAPIDEIRFDVADLAEPDGWYDFGRIRWHLGANGGLTSDVRRSEGVRITLVQAPPNPIAAGDLLTLTAGCNKTIAICTGKFDNLENFRGDPFVPGTDAILDYPGLR